MLLFPKKLRYKKIQRLKSLYKFNTKTLFLKFGYFGLKALEAYYLTNIQLEAGRMFLKKTLKKLGKIWIRCFPYKSLTRKPTETRMGKGKGKHKFWVVAIKPGTIVYEIDGSDKKVSYDLLKALTYKMPFKTKIITRIN